MRVVVLFFVCLVFLEGSTVDQLFNKKTIKVKKESIVESRSFYGATTFDESLVYDVVSRFDGYVQTLKADKRYKYFKKGEVLFSLYSDKLISIQNELKISKQINQHLKKSSIDKLKALDIHPKELNKILNSKDIVENINFYTPINSYILDKKINRGSFIKKGERVLQLVSLDKLWFIAKVYQKDLNFIDVSREASITLDGVARSLKTKVDFIYPTIDEKSKTVDVRFILDNKDLKLFTNMFGKAKVEVEKREMLTLPKTAVLNKADKFYVFIPISKSEFEPKEVEVKRVSHNRYEIVDGLEEGEVVINNALFLLDSDAVTNGLYEEDDDDW